MNSEHKKKMIAPIVITVLFLLCLVVYIVMIVQVANWSLVPFAIPLIALGIGMVYTLHSRIEEIRSGEEDDLNNY
ncbi:MAG: hypothetical protein IKH57_13610 [Clostridia bacterium]|nr:hypothetical protein [Clostridia bacterium]